MYVNRKFFKKGHRDVLPTMSNIRVDFIEHRGTVLDYNSLKTHYRITIKLNINLYPEQLVDKYVNNR